MTATQKAFLQILSDYINKRTSTNFDNNIDWHEIIEIAKIHNLSGIIYVQCRDYLKLNESLKEIYLTLQSHFKSEVYFSVYNQNEFDNINNEFKKNNINCIAIKGQVIKNYYPAPELRTMGDIDLLIKPHDREKTDRIMKKFDYGCTCHGEVWNYDLGCSHFEIHTNIIYEDLMNNFDYSGYFQSAWDHSYIGPDGQYKLDENFHFIYLIAHTAKHFTNKGCGFRPFLDMVFFTKSMNDKLNWKLIAKELKKIRLLEFTKASFSLCDSWFGVDMPLNYNKLNEDLYLEITDLTFKNGVFGHKNESNKTARFSKEIHRSGHSYLYVTVRYILKKLFPPYSDMREIPWYSFIDNRPYLLPIAWIYRFFFCIKNKFDFSKKTLFLPIKSRKEIKKKEKEITKLGL